MSYLNDEKWKSISMYVHKVEVLSYEQALMFTKEFINTDNTLNLFDIVGLLCATHGKQVHEIEKDLGVSMCL